jgi:hypothetical protein
VTTAISEAAKKPLIMMQNAIRNNCSHISDNFHRGPEAAVMQAAIATQFGSKK